MLLVAFFRPSVSLSVFTQATLCTTTMVFGAKGGHYRSEDFVCLSVISRACADNRADAVDRILIYKKTTTMHSNHS